MSEDGLLTQLHSAEFVDRWLGAYCATYRWERDGWFAVVPGLDGRRTWACAPGLAYSHLSPSAAEREAERVAGRRFHIRLLDPSVSPAAGDPVVMRIDLAARASDLDRVWREALGTTTRNLIRRAQRDGLHAEIGSGPELRAEFRRMLAATHRRHGAPMPPARLFECVAEALPCRVVLVRDANGRPVAAVLGVRDRPILWSPWAALAAQPPLGAGELAWWRFVELARDEGCDLVDFGRSPLEGGPYRFKRKFGALPVPLRRLSDRPGSLYARYELAQRLWRFLPAPIADALGPRLCRRLADY